MADDVPSYTTEEDDDMSVEEEQATAAASDPSPFDADEEKAPVPLRRSKRKRDKDSAASKPRKSAKEKKTLPSRPGPTRSSSGKRRAASSTVTSSVSGPPSQITLIYKKKTSFTGKAFYITGKPDKFRNKSIIQDIAKKMGAILAKGASGKVTLLFVMPKAPGKGTRKNCPNAKEHSENYFIESACKAVTNFPPGSTADEQLKLLIQDVSQPSSSLSQIVSFRII